MSDRCRECKDPMPEGAHPDANCCPACAEGREPFGPVANEVMREGGSLDPDDLLDASLAVAHAMDQMHKDMAAMRETVKSQGVLIARIDDHVDKLVSR